MLTVGSPTNGHRGEYQNCYLEQFYIARLTPTERTEIRNNSRLAGVAPIPLQRETSFSRRIAAVYEFNLQTGSCFREIESDSTHFQTRELRFLLWNSFVSTFPLENPTVSSKVETLEVNYKTSNSCHNDYQPILLCNKYMLKCKI